jgi:mono/diheme cytochrome c family protein
MKKTTTLLIVLGATLTMLNADKLTGEEIFDTKCSACHTKEMPKNMKDMKAPPMGKISAKIKHDFDDNKTKSIEFIIDYIQNPSQEKSKCMARAIKRFGVMPPIGKAMTKEERQVVAEWVVNNFTQKWEDKDCKARMPKCGGDKKPDMKCGAGKCGGKCGGK